MIKWTITRKQLKPEEEPLLGVSTTDPRFTAETFLTVVSSDVTVARRNAGILDFYIKSFITNFLSLLFQRSNNQN